jgi:hypothetical protein
MFCHKHDFCGSDGMAIAARTSLLVIAAYLVLRQVGPCPIIEQYTNCYFVGVGAKVLPSYK